jgi:hypothetical protein
MELMYDLLVGTDVTVDRRNKLYEMRVWTGCHIIQDTSEQVAQLR